jgi:hypothetical protein
LDANGWGLVTLLLGIAAIFVGSAAVVSRRRKLLLVLGALAAVAAVAFVIVTTFVSSLGHPGDRSSPTASALPPPSNASPSISPSIVKTEVRQLNVVDYDGTLRDGYEVEQTASGECPGGSSVLYGNPNAYRCFFEDSTGDAFVADPCLAFAGGTSVFCLYGPWDLAGTQIDLEEHVSFNPSYDQSARGDPLHPWALEVVDPRDASQSWRCRASTGATAEIAGNHASWWCVRPDGSGEASALNSLIIGDDPVWKVLFYDSEAPELIEADVAKVWE